MSRPLSAILLAASLLATTVVPAQECPGGPIGLVLSGGGARGLAHVGVIQALEARGIRPDLIVGSSIGAIVGGLYASGYSGAELEALARALPLADYLAGRPPRLPQALEQLRPVIRWQDRGRGLRLESTPPREAELNALVSALFLRGNLRARGDFDALPIRFRAVATNFRDRRVVVLAKGDLARAVRASFAIPLVFSAEAIDGEVLADGGLASNVPVGAARAAGARRLIVSDVGAVEADSGELGSATAALGRLLDFLFSQPRDSLGEHDMLVHTSLNDIASLAFTAANSDRAIAAGRDAADRALADNPCWGRVAAKAPLGPPPERPVVVSSFRLSGGSPDDARLLRERLGVRIGSRLDTMEVAGALRDVPALGTYDAVWLSASGTGDTVSLVADVEPAPRAGAALGLAYDNDVGGRLWIGALRRDFGVRGVEGWGVLFTGGLRQGVILGARRARRAGDAWAPIVEAQLARDDVRRFTAHELLAAPVANDALGLLGVELRLSSGWSAATGAEARAWSGVGALPDTTSLAGGRRRAVGAALRVLRGGSDDTHIAAEAAVTNVYRRAQLDVAVPLRWSWWAVVPRVVGGWSKELPAQARPVLGGVDGFPGLRLDDERHAHAFAGALLVSRRVTGAVEAHVEVMAGAVGDGSVMPLHDRSLAGVRGGVGMGTPVGRVRADYGVERGGHISAFVRLGHWF